MNIATNVTVRVGPEIRAEIDRIQTRLATHPDRAELLGYLPGGTSRGAIIRLLLVRGMAVIDDWLAAHPSPPEARP